MVKRFMRDSSREPEHYRGMPSIPDEFRPKLKTIGKASRCNSRRDRSQSPRTKRAAANCGADLMPQSNSAAVSAGFRVCAGLRPELDCAGLHQARIAKAVRRA